MSASSDEPGSERSRSKGSRTDLYQQGRLSRVPNQPKTPVRGFRIPDEVYRAALKAAEEKGETLSEEVRAFLERYPTMKPRRRRKKPKPSASG